MRWPKRAVKVSICIALISLLLITGAFALDGFKTPPDPAYADPPGYGWATDIPLDKPTNVWNILKVWATRTTKLVFLDKNRDGACDTVLNFEFSSLDKHGRELYVQVAPSGCDETEAGIKEFLKSKEI